LHGYALIIIFVLLYSPTRRIDTRFEVIWECSLMQFIQL